MSDDSTDEKRDKPARDKKPGLRDLVGRAVDRLGEWLSPVPVPVPVPVRLPPRRR